MFPSHDQGGEYFDIGASIGNHSVFFGVIMEADELHCFEPCLDSYDHLVKNLSLNMDSGYLAHNVALGEFLSHCNMESVSEKNIGMKQVREVEGGNIQIVPIDECEIFEGYNVIKIDVEHYNEELLKGAKETFTKGTGNIYIEPRS